MDETKETCRRQMGNACSPPDTARGGRNPPRAPHAELREGGDVTQRVKQNRGPYSSKTLWISKAVRAARQIHSSSLLTSRLLLVDVRVSGGRVLAPLSGVTVVSPPVTSTGVSSYSQHPPSPTARVAPLPVPLLSDSTPVLWCVRFPPPVSHNQRPQGSGTISDIAGEWDFFQAHIRRGCSPLRLFKK